MTETELIAAIVTAVEACSVDSIGPGDVLHHCPVPDFESALDERAFVLLPTTGSTHVHNLGSGYREVRWQLLVTYVWTPSAIARALRDSKLICNAIQGLPASNAAIGGQDGAPEVAPRFSAGLVEFSYQFATVYLAT